ncbi:MAG TPA: hypothetical protein VGF13_00045 [Verrucomicrobiae bacterium]
MKTNRLKLRRRFEQETRFNVTPCPPVPLRGMQESELEQFKNRLLTIALNEATDADFYAPLRRAAAEAVAAAWMTPFPMFFLPTLFDEKVAAAKRQFAKARSIRDRSRRILTEVF